LCLFAAIPLLVYIWAYLWIISVFIALDTPRRMRRSLQKKVTAGAVAGSAVFRTVQDPFLGAPVASCLQPPVWRWPRNREQMLQRIRTIDKFQIQSQRIWKRKQQL
jgi:hypothetical protein